MSELKKKIAQLEEELRKQKEGLGKFLSPEQINILNVDRKCIKKWSAEGIIKGLKLRFALGKKVIIFYATQDILRLHTAL